MVLFCIDLLPVFVLCFTDAFLSCYTAGVLNFTISREHPHPHEVSFYSEYGSDVIYRHFALTDRINMFIGKRFKCFFFFAFQMYVTSKAMC